MAVSKLTSKFIDVGNTGGSSGTFWGYDSGVKNTIGTLSETANGSSNVTSPNIYGSSTTIAACYWQDFITDNVFFILSGTKTNTAANWTQIRINGTVFTRASATYSTTLNTGYTTWYWATSTNPFTATVGADNNFDVEFDGNLGHLTNGVPTANLAYDSASTTTVTVVNATSTAKYLLRLTSGTTPGGWASGTVVDSQHPSPFDLDILTTYLPSAGSSASYQIQLSGGAADPTDNESGLWLNTTGLNNSFTITRDSGPSGSISFAGASFTTEGESGLEFIFDNTVDGTYYYDVNRISGTVSGGEVVNPGPSPITVSSGSARVTVTFVNDSVTEIGFQGEEFVMRYGTTSNSEDLDTLNFTLYDDDSGISYTSSTVNINGAATSHQISVVRAAGDSSTSVSAYVAVSPGFTPLSTNLSGGSGNDFILGTGTTVITVNDVPGAGSSETYYVRINNGQQFINGPTYTVTQAAVPTAPTSITFEADQNVASDTITQAVTISGGAGGNIEYSENNSTWLTYSGPTDFTFTRNSAKTIYARRNDGGALSSVSQSSKTYGYFTGDPSAEGTPAETSISANDLTGVAITITGGSANTRYRIVNTTLGAGIGNTGDGNGTVTATGDTGDLPGKGETDDYKVQYKVIPTKGGDDTWRDVVPADTFTISRTDDIPNAFTLDTLSNQALDTEVEDSVQITGITQEAVVSRTGGTGSFAVGTSTTPGTYSTADKTITNGQYLWVKDTTSTSNGTAKSTTISIGTATLASSPAVQSSTFSYTTAAAGDVTVTIVYDQESGTFLPDPGFSPVVSGQNGLSNAQAYEITAGTDVVFQNTSDPGSFGVIVSGLTKFTNNNSFSLNQGQSVTRTWASGQLGNTVNTVTLTGQSATDFIYFKQPAVAPDTDVTPVTPANIDWDQTTAFNVTVNDVTSGETYKITENNFTTSLGSATASGTSVTIPMTLGNSTTGYGQLGLGDTQTYEIHASRPTNLGGTGSFVQTDDTFTVTRSSQVVVTPTDITFSPASTVSNSTNVTVTVVGDSSEGRTLQVRIGSGSWLTSPQTYNLTRGTTYSFSARTLGFQGESTSGLRVESYLVPYLSPDSSVSVVVTTTIAANAGNQTVRVQNGNAVDVYTVTSLDGSTIYDTQTGNGNLTLTASGPDELPASGSNQSYRVRAQRPILSGGNDTPVNTSGTNNNFTITRSAPTTPTVTIDADPGTRSKSVSLGVDASGGTGSTFVVSENNSTFVASGTAFEFTRGVNKTVYGRGVTDGTQGTSGTASRQLAFIAPDTAISLSLSKSTITAGETASITANFSGGTSGDIVDLRTNDTNTPLNSGVSVGTATFNGSGTAAITISSGEQPDVTGTSAQYRAYVQTPDALGGDASYDATSVTASITRGTISQPNPPSIPDDTTTRSQSVSLTVTVSGGSGGVLELSEDNSTWITTASQAFEFTRGTGKTIYARRRDGAVVSSTSQASRTLGYIAPDTDVLLALSASSISPGSTATITASVRNVTSGERYRILTTNANTQNGTIGFNVGSASARLTTTVGIALTNALNELPSFSSGQVEATYKLQALNFIYNGGDQGWDDTGDTFTITRRAFTAPNAPSIPNDTTTRSKSVSLTVTVSGGAEGSLQLSEDNTNWFTTSSQAFVFTRNVAKTIYARRIDGTQVSSTTQASRTLSFINPDTTIGLNLSSSSITAGATANVTASFTGGTQGDIVQLRTNDTNTPLASGTSVGSDTFDGSGIAAITISSGEQPDVLNTTAQYRAFVETPSALGGDDNFDGSVTASITRGTISAPTSIQFPSDPGTSSKSVSLTVTISGGSGGNLQISEDNSTWFTNNSRAFEFTRNTSKTIYARRNDNGTLSGVTTSSFTLGYLAGDPIVTLNVSESTLAFSNTDNVTAGITNGGTTSLYRLVNNATPSTVYDTVTGNSTLTLQYPAELPTAGNSIQYRLQYARTEASGGDPDNWQTATPATFTVDREAADRTPETFTALAGNVADADLSTQHYATFSGTTAGTTSPGTGLNVGTTIDNGTAISVSNGEYSLNAGSSWLSGAATINQNQVVYYRGQSSGTNGTPTTHSLTIGDTTRSFTTTTFGDSFPDNYTNLAGNNIDADFNTVYYATFSTTPPGTTSPGTAFNVGTTVSDGTSVSVNNGQYRINNGSFTSTPGQINQNDDIYFRSNATASASGQSLIPSLTIGSISHNFQLKTGTLPGGSAGLAKGTDVYGITLYGPDGSTEVWGTNVRQTNIVIKEYFTLPNGSSSSFTCVDANDDTKVIVSVGAPYPSSRSEARAASENLSVSKTSTGFTVTNQDNPSDANNTSSALAVRVIAARIS